MNSLEKWQELQKLSEPLTTLNTTYDTTLKNEEVPEHYSNEKGSLYKIGLERGWNPYQFDAIKRIDRAYKKGQFNEDIEKTQLVLKLMLNNK
tara:strand:+ start:147 stop:422 length:276 start_codon:yes stop_codon:yes gene_type:complete